MSYEEFINLFVNHHKGHEDPIERRELKKLVKDDRQAREYISQAWRDRYIIINDGRGKGYYLYDPVADRGRLTIYLAKEKSRKDSLDEKLDIGYEVLAEEVSA